jgi:signal transduction histidine kinase
MKPLLRILDDEPWVQARDEVAIRGAITPCDRRCANELLFEMTTEQMGERRSKLAKMLHEELGQQLAGTLLAAGALSARLTRRRAPEATEASYLVEMLMNANNELACLIKHLDAGKLR